MTIFYLFDGKIYANITNKCPCACEFCIRKNSDSVGTNDSLWLEHEPCYEEIIGAFDEIDKSGVKELVFCGYGEPMERADMVIRIAKYVKEKTGMKIRINTNGLVDFIHPEFDVMSMKGVIDSISISLNAASPDKYNEITKPKFGLPSYNAMLNFAILAKSVVGDVTFTVVDMISDEEIEDCRQRAADIGVPLRVRHYVKDNVNYI